MSAQEELEKLEHDVGERIAQCNAEDLPEQALALAWVRDRIAAIREGLGKAQGEVQAYLTDEGSLLPVCFANEYRARGARLIPLYASAAPPANSAQVLVDALGWSPEVEEAMLKAPWRGSLTDFIRDAWPLGVAAALAAHKSEVKG